MDLADAIKTLTEAGAKIVLPSERHLSIGNAAKMIDISKGWIRSHLQEFPNAWRMPGGELRFTENDCAAIKRRIETGELRIPVRDIEDLARRNRLASQEQRRAA